jgi:hypothetical protein
MYDPEKVTYFASTDSRNKRVRFGIKAKDRTKHMYVIGKTGMGKSTLLENLAIQDLINGNGLAVIDPHGSFAEALLDFVPEHRIDDVLYFAPFDMDYPISFNVMEDVGPDKRHLVANGLMSAFKKIWVDAWSARMEYILNNILLALLEYPDATLVGVNRMLADKDYRNKVIDNITDPSVKSFWVDEFNKYGERYMQEAGAAIQNKIGQFISNPIIRNIIGQPKSSFDLREIMDSEKIIIVNLSKGRVGEANANLLGGMLVTKIYLAAMSRADLSAEVMKSMPNFYLFVDEFQSFANESFADILSEARKYSLNLTIAHQYVEQMPEEVRFAVFGNVGTMITFRVGAFDAEIFEKEYAPQFAAQDLVNLGFAQIYLKLMINGVSSQPFSAATLPPWPRPEVSYRDRIIERSRAQFAEHRSEVENAIRKWHEEGKAEDRPPQKKPQSAGGMGGSSQGQGAPRSQAPRSPAPARPEVPFDPMRVPRAEGAKGSAPRADGPRPASRQDLPPRSPQAPRQSLPQHPPQKSHVREQKKEEQEERERGLRQAVSLNMLKSSNERERVQKKEMTEENAEALRSALGSVLTQMGVKTEEKKDDAPAMHAPVERPAEKPPVIVVAPVAVPTPAVNVPPPKPQEKREERPAKSDVPIVHIENVLINPSAPAAPVSRPAPQQPKREDRGIDEVPRDVLESALRLDDDGVSQ